MRGLLALALLAVLGAGCLEADTPPATDSDGDDGRSGRTGRGSEEAGDESGRYEGSFNLAVTSDTAVSVGGVVEGNCVLFWDVGGSDYTLRNGTATLEWSAATPLAETLAMYVTGLAGPSVSGPSPLVLPIEELEAEGWGLGFAADAPLGTLAVAQEVRLTLAFDHEGGLPSPGVGSCSNGP